MHGALGELDKACAAVADREWLVSDRVGTTDITVACFATYAREAVPEPLDAFPALRARVDRCEALPVFRRYCAPFFQPDASGTARA
jgi:glutathione S-transferase